MKRLGLVGGTSFPSTLLYYQRLNELYHQQKGGFHSCPLTLHNIDYHAIKSRYHSGWDEIPALLKAEFLQLLASGPGGLILCNNTLHKALDTFRHELPPGIPVFHVVTLTRDHLQRQGWQKVLLLGTQFTMEDTFFRQPLMEAGFQVDVPGAIERQQIQHIQNRLAQGRMQHSDIAYFQQLCHAYETYDAIILGCTELPLVFTHVTSRPALINPIELQCRAAVDFLLSEKL